MRGPEHITFCRELAALRRKAKLNARALADAIGCPPSTLSNYCTGRQWPPVDFVRDFVIHCGGSPGQVMAWMERWRGLDLTEGLQASVVTPLAWPARLSANGVDVLVFVDGVTPPASFSASSIINGVRVEIAVSIKPAE